MQAKEITERILRQVIEESKIPNAVHQAVIKRLTKAIELHKADIDKWQKVIDSHKIARGEDGKTPTKEDLLSLIEPLIPIVKNGEDYVLTSEDKKEIALKIKVPVVKQVIEKTEVIREIPIVTEKLIEKDVNEEKLLANLVKLLKKKQLLDIDDIKGGRSFVKDGTRYLIEELMHGGGGSSGGSITYSYDLSSQCDGVNKVFTVPANTNFVQLSGTDSPIIYKPITDYTGTGTTTLTLDAGINAPSSGATLILLYVV